MQEYCIRSSVTISHSPGADRAKAHSHSIEIAAYVEKAGDGFEQFQMLEKEINAYLGHYENRYLNDAPEFRGNTSLENMGEVFFHGLSEALKNADLTLIRLEVGETPLRVYAVGVENQINPERETEETEVTFSGMGAYWHEANY